MLTVRKKVSLFHALKASGRKPGTKNLLHLFSQRLLLTVRASSLPIKAVIPTFALKQRPRGKKKDYLKNTLNSWSQVRSMEFGGLWRV